MDAEQRLTNLMNRAVATVEPPTGDLVAGAVARGRRLRRRRTVTQLGSALAVCGLIGGVAAAVATIPSDRAHTGGMPAAGTSSAASSTAPSNAVAVPPPGTPLTEQSVVQMFQSLLPPGASVTEREGHTAMRSGVVTAVVTYRDGHGAAEIDLAFLFDLEHSGASAPPEQTRHWCEVNACIERPDGAQLQVYKGSLHSSDPGGEPKLWNVGLRHMDGTAVTISEWNSTQGSAESVTRKVPPLTIDQLTAIVSDPAWANLVPPK